ncbi:MAG: MBL fold metallo-hydrolase [Candidatus Binatia bacterium]|nr:MBL fold metallo-hydrolase [Candidatus Binatia bacterium]
MSASTLASDPLFGPVTLLEGPAKGRYPEGNSLLVEGNRETVIIDPSLGLLGREGPLPRVARVLNSHCHEDHVAGNHLFPDVPWHFHELDAPGIKSLDAMLAIYGFPAWIEAPFRGVLVDQFHFVTRDDPQTYVEGDTFDLGGVTIRVLHTPGHTRGHCCFEIEWTDAGRPRRLIYLADIELTSFGPYYGDAWSNLVDFENSLARVREIEADWYATFHHIGVLKGRDAFLARLDKFEAMIADREGRLLDYLAEPHDMDDIVKHRFVYRPVDAVSFADSVEKRSAEQHLERLVASGRVRELPEGRWQRA